MKWRCNIGLGLDIFSLILLKSNFFKDSSYSSVAATTTTNQFKGKRWKTDAGGFRLGKLRASRIAERLKPDDEGGKKDGEASSGNDGEDDDPLLMDEEERQEWRRKIREVIVMNRMSKRR
ncbi:unnamed protein product [Camellia sinensis]